MGWGGRGLSHGKRGAELTWQTRMNIWAIWIVDWFSCIFFFSLAFPCAAEDSQSATS